MVNLAGSRVRGVAESRFGGRITLTRGLADSRTCEPATPANREPATPDYRARSASLVRTL